MAYRGLSDGERAILAEDGPEEDVLPEVLSDRVHTARKDHFCDTCEGGGILKGERYRCVVMIEDGQRVIRRYCIADDRGGSKGCWREDARVQQALAEQDRAYAQMAKEKEQYGPDDLPF